jgi:hypothetical protein
MASMSFKNKDWGELSCVPSRHQYDEEIKNKVSVQDETFRRKAYA